MIADVLYRWLGHDQFGDGQPGPPGDGLSIRVGEPEMHDGGVVKPPYVVMTDNDGFELWIGADHKWYWHCRWPEAWRIAVFILWTWWARGTWFGLRRRLWYWALSRRVQRRPR